MEDEELHGVHGDGRKGGGLVVTVMPLVDVFVENGDVEKPVHIVGQAI